MVRLRLRLRLRLRVRERFGTLGPRTLVQIGIILAIRTPSSELSRASSGDIVHASQIGLVCFEGDVAKPRNTPEMIAIMVDCEMYLLQHLRATFATFATGVL